MIFWKIWSSLFLQAFASLFFLFFPGLIERELREEDKTKLKSALADLSSNKTMLEAAFPVFISCGEIDPRASVKMLRRVCEDTRRFDKQLGCLLVFDMTFRHLCAFSCTTFIPSDLSISFPLHVLFFFCLLFEFKPLFFMVEVVFVSSFLIFSVYFIFCALFAFIRFTSQKDKCGKDEDDADFDFLSEPLALFSLRELPRMISSSAKRANSDELRQMEEV